MNSLFPDSVFVILFSSGVLHHSPSRVIREFYRVLRPEGISRILIYSKYPLVRFMLWLHYWLSLFMSLTSLDAIHFRHFESPGAKVYTSMQSLQRFSDFTYASISTSLCHAVLLKSELVQFHRSLSLSFVRIIWPRWVIRQFFQNYGLTMLVTTYKYFL